MDLQKWLFENKTLILFSFTFILIFIIIGLLIWGKKLSDLKKKLWEINQQLAKKNGELNSRDERINLEKERNKIHTENLQKKEIQLESLNENLIGKEKNLIKQIEINFQREQEWQEKNQLLIEKQQKVEEKLWETAQISKEEAKKILTDKVEKEVAENLNKYTQQEIRKAKENLDQEITKIICLALERYSTELVFSKTVNFLTVDNRKILSKIIGKDGKNINFFRKITGTDIIIDRAKENQKEKELLVEVSSFNSLRREIATRTLERLIIQQKITPLQIEAVYLEISQEVEKIIQQSGEGVLRELQIIDFPQGLLKYLGKLKFRTSYGQNVLEHCLEVAKIAGFIATELDLDSELAKRAGLLHDIGKAVEIEENISHVTAGVTLAKQYGESEIIINAIAAHHRDIPTNNPYSLIVMAADTLSAARPGARGQQLETFLARIEGLEKLAKEIPGVAKTYAFQSGREIWVFVDTEKVSDYQMLALSQTVKKRIQEQIVIPGEITISVFREKIITEKLTNSGTKYLRNERPIYHANSQSNSNEPKKRPKRRKKAPGN